MTKHVGKLITLLILTVPVIGMSRRPNFYFDNIELKVAMNKYKEARKKFAECLNNPLTATDVSSTGVSRKDYMKSLRELYQECHEDIKKFRKYNLDSGSDLTAKELQNIESCAAINEKINGCRIMHKPSKEELIHYSKLTLLDDEWDKAMQEEVVRVLSKNN